MSVSCNPQCGDVLWSAKLAADPFGVRGTVFGLVWVTLPDGRDLPTQQIWLNDLAELRNSAKTRGIGETMKHLGRPHATSEYQRIFSLSYQWSPLAFSHSIQVSHFRTSHAPGMSSIQIVLVQARVDPLLRRGGPLPLDL